MIVKALILFTIFGVAGCSFGIGVKQDQEASVGEVPGVDVRDVTESWSTPGGGVLLTAFSGGVIGGLLDTMDKRYAAEAFVKAIQNSRTGETIRWNNPNSGHSGAYTPTLAYRTEGGVYCREFTQSISVAQDFKEASGTACRRDGEKWEIVDE